MIAVLVPAAGRSSRFGSPKTLHKIGDQTLLETLLERVARTDLEPIFVVTGQPEQEAAERDVFSRMRSKGVRVIPVINTANTGLGSSIASGMTAITRYNESIKINVKITSLLIVLADQQAISEQSLSTLIDTSRQHANQIVCSRYQNSNGVPALFPDRYFPQLAALRGDRGAKTMLDTENVYAVDLPEAAIDIDCMEDLRRLDTTDS